MEIRFLNVDLEIESHEDLQILVDELQKNCSVSIHDKNLNGNNFAVFSHHSAFESFEVNKIICLFCNEIEKLPPKARTIWNQCLKRKFDAGFESGKVPRDFQVDIQNDVLKRVSNSAEASP